MTETRLVLAVVAACAAFSLLIVGCGGGSGSGTEDPASVAPPGTALFVEATLRPQGQLKANVDKLFEGLTGKNTGLGELITGEIEKVARGDGEPFSYAEDVEPWLGEKAGAALGEYDGSNFSNVSIAIQSTDTGATRSFIDKLTEEGGKKVRDGSFEGVAFKVESDGTSLGVIGDFLVFAQSEAAFREAVEAHNGESLADAAKYGSIADKASDGSLLEVYVDIAGLIEQAGNQVDPQTEQVLNAAGVNLSEATALLSLVPGSDSLELDLTSNADMELAAPAAEGLLESLPAKSFAAVASSDYGKRLQENLDRLDESGIPGSLPPHQLKRALKREGIEVERIAGQLKEAAIFAVGASRTTLGGAAVLTTKNPSEARNTVADIGLLLRANHTSGVTAISGKAAGFSIHSSSLGRKPLVIAAEGERIAIGYGLPGALEGLGPVKEPLSQNPSFVEAKQALGGTPITGFIDGPAALRLIEALVPPSESGFQSARPYLGKIAYVGIGAETEAGLATVKMVAGLKH